MGIPGTTQTGSVPTTAKWATCINDDDYSGRTGLPGCTVCNELSPPAAEAQTPATSGPPSNGVCPHSTTAVRLERLRRQQWLHRFYQLHRLQRTVPQPQRDTRRPPVGPHPTGSVPIAPPRSGWSDYGDNSGCTGFISYTGCNELSLRPHRDRPRPTSESLSNGVCPHSTNKVRLERLQRQQSLHRFYQLHRLQRTVSQPHRDRPRPPVGPHPTGSVPTAPLRSGWSDYSDNSGCNGFTSYTGCNDRSPRAQRDRPRPTKGSSSNGVCPHTTTAARSERLRRRQWLQRFYQLHRLQRAVPSAAKGRTPGATSGPPANGVCPHSTTAVRLE
ncbi:MAG: hypothetical protein RL215_3499, partial [Planctomycetota bacterium]